MGKILEYLPVYQISYRKQVIQDYELFRLLVVYHDLKAI